MTPSHCICFCLRPFLPVTPWQSLSIISINSVTITGSMYISKQDAPSRIRKDTHCSLEDPLTVAGPPHRLTGKVIQANDWGDLSLMLVEAESAVNWSTITKKFAIRVRWGTELENSTNKPKQHHQRPANCSSDQHWIQGDLGDHGLWREEPTASSQLLFSSEPDSDAEHQSKLSQGRISSASPHQHLWTKALQRY